MLFGGCRYLVSVTAIAFGYSAFHIYAKVHHVILKKYIIRSPINYYFDLTMDQVGINLVLLYIYNIILSEFTV